MHTIYKYPLEVLDIQYLDLPIGAKILSLQTQFGRPKIWALVSDHPEAPKQKVTFYTFGTGTEIPETLLPFIEFLGNYYLYDGRGVFHVFTHISRK